MNHCAICGKQIATDETLCEPCCNLKRTVADLQQQKTGQQAYVERVRILGKQLGERKGADNGDA